MIVVVLAFINGPMHFSSVYRFLEHVKGLYAAAFGIEIVSITAAEMGENTGLYLFGLNPLVIAIAHSMRYALAGFTTFVTILGRYGYGSLNKTTCSCSSVFEQESDKGFVLNVSATQKSCSKSWEDYCLYMGNQEEHNMNEFNNAEY
jgi:hypothetical protein